jgi:type I restriction enzyme S subunit
MTIAMPLIDISPDHWAIVHDILHKHVPQYAVWAFGSRAKWTAKEYSDLDLAIITDSPLSLDVSASLSDDFSESDLPWKVDVVDWASTSESFRKIIERDKVMVQEGKQSLGVANEWGSRPLRDCATWYSGGTPRKGNPEYWNGSIPWISAKSLTEFFVHDSEDKVTEAGAENGTRLVPKNTILFIVRGMSLKSEFRMGITTKPVTFNQDLKALIALDDVLPAFLAYAIKGRTQEILALVGEAGHGTGVLPTDRIQGLDILLPPIEEQRAIAHILGALDDKIELNRKQNETLEAMARALFKAWFVDFEPVRAKMEGRWQRGQSLASLPAHLYDIFPDRLVESELGEIPEGWRNSTIGEEVTVCGGSTPSTKEPEYWEGGQHCWATPKDLSALYFPVLLDTDRKITDAGLAKISSGLLPVGTVLLSSRAPIGYLAIAEIPTAINQGFIAMKCDGALPNVFVLPWCRESMDAIIGNANGSTFQEISKSNFRPLRVVVPSDPVLTSFTRSAGSLYRQLAENEREARYLAQLRDTLLPKLISGELRVPDAERLLGEVAQA